MNKEKTFEFKENFLHFIWQYRLFHHAAYLKTGEMVECIQPGRLNTNSGPDFSTAKVRIQGTLWVGNVEIHIKASDWFTHGHHLDAAYDNIILHIVYDNDQIIYRKSGEQIPCLCLAELIDQRIIDRYKILNTPSKLACGTLATELDPFTKTKCLEQMGIARLQLKCKRIQNELDYQKMNWEACFFTLICRAFGGAVNGETYEQLSRIIPLNVLARQKNSLLQLEAIFFGQAGFLEQQNHLEDDEYLQALTREFKHLKRKYQLKSLAESNWKFMRMRPSSFPLLRLSQMANLIYLSSHLFRKVMQTTRLEGFYTLLECSGSDYWDTHFKFGVEGKKKSSKLGQGMKVNVIINALIPMLFYYGKVKEQPELLERALQFLESIEPEKNQVVRLFEAAGIKAYSALHTQAMLHLHQNYCQQAACLQCGIGYALLKL